MQLGLIQPCCPHRGPAGRQGQHGLPEPVERAVQDRVPHGQAPHGAGLPGFGIMGVIADTARAAPASPPGSCRKASATGAVRMSDPLPPDLPVRAWWAEAAPASIAAEGRDPAPARTERVWTPTSGAERAQSAHRLATLSSATSWRRLPPSAVTSAMATAIEVSSVHSPGAHPKLPPPIIPTARLPPSGGPNS